MHFRHFVDSYTAKQQSVEEHKHSVTVALVYRFKVVGEKRHQISDLVSLIILHGKILAVIEHFVAYISFNLYSRAEKADSPQKSTDHKSQNYEYHRHTDLVNKKRHVKRDTAALRFNVSAFYAVYYHSVKLGYLELKYVYDEKREDAEQQPMQILKVVFIYVFSEYQSENLLSEKKARIARGSLYKLYHKYNYFSRFL